MTPNDSFPEEDVPSWWWMIAFVALLAMLALMLQHWEKW